MFYAYRLKSANHQIGVCRELALPFGEGGRAKRGRERFAAFEVFLALFSKTIPEKPLPSALRAATFPKGEGKALRAPLLQTLIFRSVRFDLRYYFSKGKAPLMVERCFLRRGPVSRVLS